MINFPLPEAFAWQAHVSGHALTLCGQIIALTADLPNGRASTVRRLQTRSMARQFHDNRESAALFLARWATRWEDQIIALYTSLPTSTYQAAPTGLIGKCARVDVPRRRPRRRSR